MKHFVPLDVKTEKKFSPKIFMFDFFFIIGFAGFGWATQNIVITALRTLYLVFCFAVGFFLSRPSQNNPGKRLYQSFWFYLIRPRTAYIPVQTSKKRLTLDKSINKKQYPSAAYFKELVFPDGGISNEKKDPD